MNTSSLGHRRFWLCVFICGFCLWTSRGFAGADGDAATPPPQEADAGQPVTIANARQFDITSKLNGETYRIMVYTSPKNHAGEPQPVVYVLDGNYYFATACDAMGVNLLSGIIVGIGYPTDDRDEMVRRREFDLTLPTPHPSATKHGGGDEFLRVVQNEIKPFVMARYKIDPARQSLFGHSLGGLMTLREMLRNPQDYSTYLVASPSIWWNDRAVLADEDAFDNRARAGELHLKILLTSAADEQYHGDDAALVKKAKRLAMVDNVTELASRLSALNPQNVSVTRAIFPDETHRSGSQAALVRSLCFALHAAE
jgi:predicted alpha/beta superfamily hydrolase